MCPSPVGTGPVDGGECYGDAGAPDGTDVDGGAAHPVHYVGGGEGLAWGSYRNVDAEVAQGGYALTELDLVSPGHCTPVRMKEEVDVHEPWRTSPSLRWPDFAKSLATSTGSILAANTPRPMADLNWCARTASTVASQISTK